MPRSVTVGKCSRKRRLGLKLIREKRKNATRTRTEKGVLAPKENLRTEVRVLFISECNSIGKDFIDTVFYTSKINHGTTYFAKRLQKPHIFWSQEKSHRIRAQMKRHHGETKSRNEVWCNKVKKDDSSVPSNSVLKRLQQLTQGGPSTSSDVPEVSQENPTENKDQELCLKIKNSLKRLRRKSNGEESDNDNEQSPLLNLEVYPDEAEHPGETNDDPKTDKDTEEEPSAEFHDESQPQELLCIRKDKPKPKPPKLPIKPKKRNPRRRVVIEQEIKKSIIAARNAPALEKVFVNSVKKPEVEITNKGKKTKRDTAEIPSHFDHTEQLYEFGKYVAEQMICFDAKDVRLAQAEIKEVLSKFRLKYKIMNCISKPNNGQPETDTDRHIDISVTQPAKTQPKVLTQPAKTQPKVLTQPAKTQPKVLTQPAKTQPKVYSGRQILAQKSGTQMKSTGTVMESASQTNFTGQSVTKSVTQLKTAPSLVIQPGPQVNTARPSATHSGLPQAISFVPPLNELGVLNRNSSTSTPLGFVIVPTMAGPGFQITQRVDSAGTMATQPGTSYVLAVESPASQPGFSLMNVDESPATQPGFSLMNVDESPATQPGFSPMNVVDSRVTHPGSSHVISAGTSVTQPGNSEIPDTPFKMPETHFIDASAEPESLIVKCEVESDDET